MAINEFENVDYLEEARGRVTQQFKEKPVFDKYLQLLISEQVDLEAVMQDLMQKRSIDTAEGYQLDLIGALVGQSRTLILQEDVPYFGYLADPESEPYSSLEEPESGGMFRSLNTPASGNVRLDDTNYRLVIKARILANTSKCTPEDVIHSIKFLLGTSTASINETGNAHLTLGISRPLSEIEEYLIKGQSGATKGLIPVPAGVGVEYIQYDENGVFGFNEDPTALGFSDLQELPVESGYGELFGYSYGIGAEVGYGEAYGYLYGGGSAGATGLFPVGGGTFAKII